MDRPSLDDLKEERDGHTSAGRFRENDTPPCEFCGEGWSPQKGRVQVVGTKTVQGEGGRRKCLSLWAHKECSP